MTEERFLKNLKSTLNELSDTFSWIWTLDHRHKETIYHFIWSGLITKTLAYASSVLPVERWWHLLAKYLLSITSCYEGKKSWIIKVWLSIFFSNARLSHFHLSASCLGNADAAFIAWLTCRGRVISDQEDNTQTKTLLHMNCTNSCTFTLFSPGQVSSVFLKPLSETKIPVAWLDTVDLIAWNDGASFLLLICLNRWSALSARSRWCYGQLIPSSILFYP